MQPNDTFHPTETNPVQQPQPAVNPLPPTLAPTPTRPQQDSNGSLTGAFGLFKPSQKAWSVNFKTLLLLSLLILIPVAGLIGALFAAFISKTYFAGNAAAAQATNVSTLIIGILMLVAIILLVLLLSASLIKVQLCSVRGEKIGVKAALREGRKYWIRLLGMSLIVGLLTVCGFILLIVPGLFIMKRYLLSSYYLIDKDLGINEAMKECAKDSKNGIWGIVGVQIAIGLFSIIPVIGSLITLLLQALYYFAPAVRYEEIQTMNGTPSQGYQVASSPLVAPVAAV